MTVCDDFNAQQLTFSAAVWSAIHNGNPGQWVWNLDLGSSLITGFSFYNLGSPFYWISLLFPQGFFPYLVGPLYIFKYVTATMTAYLYLNCFIPADSTCESVIVPQNPLKVKPDVAVIGALLYAFSGFQTINLEFNHFHDVVAVFPLLLWGIENIDEKKKRPAFIIAVAINCLINYFFFIQSVVFMLIYFIFRFWGIDIKLFFRKMLHCCLCGIIGVGIASIIFIPSVLYITGNTRSDVAFYLNNLVSDSGGVLFLLKGILFPADCMRDLSAVNQMNWNSTSCYIPLFVFFFVFAYCRRQKTWLRNILIFLAIVCFCPLLTSSFLMFTAYYQRWWYALVMMFALATEEVLKNPDDYAIGKGTFWYLFICFVYYIAVTCIDYDTGTASVVYHSERFAYFFIIAVAGPVLVDLCRRCHFFRECTLLPLTMGACILTTALTLHYYREDTNFKSYKDSYESAKFLQTVSLNNQYRYTSADNVQTLVGNIAGSGVFSSTIENSSHEFQRLLDIDSGNSTQNRGSINGVLQLLGCKYALTGDPGAVDLINTVNCGNTSLYITEQPACPIGFAVEDYILASEVKALPQEQRGIAMLNAAVVYSEDESKVSKILQHINTEAINYNESPNDLSLKAESAGVKNFRRDNHGFSCLTDYDKDSFVYFSVPNDKGWHAYIDGNEKEIIDSAGMMLLNVPSGEHSIYFHYSTPGLKIGACVSAVSILILLIIAIVYRKEDDHEQAKAAE